MMMCREYIFRLTSGQLATATLSLRLQARLHRLGCPTCRQFTRNNARLDRWLDDYRQQLDASDQPMDSE
ncbi:hypothetical protein KAM380_082340 [Aeromonas caviae]|nr:hypothetical protein KAM380_082340 [Aeromonas caviae]